MNFPCQFRVIARACLSSLLILNSSCARDVAEEVEVEFSFFYRETAQSEPETKRFTLTLPIVKGVVPDIRRGISEDARFKNMVGTVLIEHNSIRIQFRGEKGLITETLFQIHKTPTNSFSGGHGFTGLQYAYDSTSDAQIQFFAKVKNKENSAEQDRAGQPATRPESKSKGGDKPQPEAEGRSR